MTIQYTVHDVALIKIEEELTRPNGTKTTGLAPALRAQLIDPVSDTIVTLTETDEAKFDEFRAAFKEGSTVVGTFGPKE